MAREMIQRRVSAIWNNSDGLDVLCFGFGEAFLGDVSHGSRRAIFAAPAAQGASTWPEHAPCATTLVDEDRLPFTDALFDRILVVHGIEDSASPDRLLRELWRIAAPEARILLVVANRSGLWARAEATPFGHGRPYSKTQLDALLQSAMFQPTAWARALYAPPTPWPFITSAGEAWERAGEIGWRSFGGVVMVEATKRLYVDPKSGGVEPVKVRLRSVKPANADPARMPQVKVKKESHKVKVEEAA